MSLIICTECGKEYSDRASACPNCACPSPRVDNAKSSAGEPAAKAKFKPYIVIVLVITLVCLAVVSVFIYKDYLYSSGLRAMQIGDYSTARSSLEGLDYKNSELILNDISFLEDLKKIVEEEIAHDSEIEYIMNAAESNLNKLRKYKAVEFYTGGLNQIVDQYIEGLERIIDALDIEEPVSAEYELLAGKYYCDIVVVELHDKLGFMQNSSRYEEVYTDIILKDEALLAAFRELVEKGNVVAKDGDFWTNEIRLYLRNDTEYKFDQTYIFDFYSYNRDKFLETVRR